MNYKKNIAVICNYKISPDRIGGMDRFFKEYNLKLIQKGHKVSWFFIGKEKFEFYEEFDLHLTGDGQLETEVIKYIKKKKDVDFVVTHFLALCTPFFKELKKNNARFIIAVDHNPRPLNGFSLEKRIKNKLQGLIYSPYIDKFISVSQYSKEAILNDFGSRLKGKIIVIPNGVDTFLYHQKNTISIPAKNFLVTSHLRKEKGIQDLIKAIARLEGLPNLNFRIDLYGEGPYKEELMNLVSDSKLDSYFRFLGSSSVLHEIYPNYDYLIQPSHGETFCFSIVESLISGLPVITTYKIGNVLGLVKNGVNGFLYQVKNIEELKGILQRLIVGDLYIEKPFNTCQISENFDLEKMVKAYLKLLPCT